MLIEYPNIPKAYNVDDCTWANQEIKYLKDLKWICYEKAEGIQIRVYWDGSEVKFYGRTNNDEVPQSFLRTLQFTFTPGDLKSICGSTPIILFCEGVGGDASPQYQIDPHIVLFDAYYPKFKTWLSRESVSSLSSQFVVANTSCLFVGTLYEAIKFIKMEPKSCLGDTTIHGLICRPTTDLCNSRGERIIVKLDTADFLEEQNKDNKGVRIHFDKELFWPSPRTRSFYEESETEQFKGYGRVVIPTKTKLPPYPYYAEN